MQVENAAIIHHQLDEAMKDHEHEAVLSAMAAQKTTEEKTKVIFQINFATKFVL